ncbi:MAG: sigma factor [Phycisphaerales bacterium]
MVAEERRIDERLSKETGTAVASGMTREEECALGWAIRNDNCHESREKMILSHLHLVSRIAAKYVDRGVALGELMCRGRDGLVRAVEHFDPAQGYRFSTPASWWIRESIRGALREAEAGSPGGNAARIDLRAGGFSRVSAVATSMQQQWGHYEAPRGFGRDRAE